MIKSFLANRYFSAAITGSALVLAVSEYFELRTQYRDSLINGTEPFEQFKKNNNGRTILNISLRSMPDILHIISLNTMNGHHIPSKIPVFTGKNVLSSNYSTNIKSGYDYCSRYKSLMDDNAAKIIYEGTAKYTIPCFMVEQVALESIEKAIFRSNSEKKLSNVSLIVESLSNCYSSFSGRQDIPPDGHVPHVANNNSDNESDAMEGDVGEADPLFSMLRWVNLGFQLDNPQHFLDKTGGNDSKDKVVYPHIEVIPVTMNYFSNPSYKMAYLQHFGTFSRPWDWIQLDVGVALAGSIDSLIHDFVNSGEEVDESTVIALPVETILKPKQVGNASFLRVARRNLRSWLMTGNNHNNYPLELQKCSIAVPDSTDKIVENNEISDESSALKFPVLGLIDYGVSTLGHFIITGGISTLQYAVDGVVNSLECVGDGVSYGTAAIIDGVLYGAGGIVDGVLYGAGTIVDGIYYSFHYCVYIPVVSLISLPSNINFDFVGKSWLSLHDSVDTTASWVWSGANAVMIYSMDVMKSFQNISSNVSVGLYSYLSIAGSNMVSSMKNCTLMHIYRYIRSFGSPRKKKLVIVVDVCEGNIQQQQQHGLNSRLEKAKQQQEELIDGTQSYDSMSTMLGNYFKDIYCGEIFESEHVSHPLISSSVSYSVFDISNGLDDKLVTHKSIPSFLRKPDRKLTHAEASSGLGKTTSTVGNSQDDVFIIVKKSNDAFTYLAANRYVSAAIAEDSANTGRKPTRGSTSQIDIGNKRKLHICIILNESMKGSICENFDGENNSTTMRNHNVSTSIISLRDLEDRLWDYTTENIKKQQTNGNPSADIDCWGNFNFT